MEDSMVHESIGVKITLLAIKDISYFFAYYCFFPVYDFIILQLQTYTYLTPYTQGVLNDIKLVLGTIIALFILIKLITGTIKNIKELRSSKNKDEKK